MFFILEIQLTALQVDVIDIEVVLVQLHVDHLLAALVHLVLLEARIDLANLLVDFALLLLRSDLLEFRLRSVHDLVSLDDIWLLVTKMQVNERSTHLDGTALPRENLESFLHHDKRSKLAEVVHKEELVIKEFYLSMVA